MKIANFTFKEEELKTFKEEELKNKYKSLSELNKKRSFEINYKNKTITLLDSKVYNSREIGYFYNGGIILYLGMSWKELEVITKLYNHLFKQAE